MLIAAGTRVVASPGHAGHADCGRAQGGGVCARQGGGRPRQEYGGRQRQGRVVRLLSLFAPSAGWKDDGEVKLVALRAEHRVEGQRRGQVGQGRQARASSIRRRENSSRGVVGEETRSV